MFPQVRSWCRRHFWEPSSELLDVPALKQQISSINDPELFNAVERIADHMLSDACSRGATLESKAMSILGWTSAGAAIFIARAPTITNLPRLQIAVIVLGAIAAVACI